MSRQIVFALPESSPLGEFKRLIFVGIRPAVALIRPSVVAIKGKFKHLELERHYEITIERAFLTQDLPGSFFRRPLGERTYSFIASDAIISARS
jgi:hypothetical protein